MYFPFSLPLLSLTPRQYGFCQYLFCLPTLLGFSEINQTKPKLKPKPKPNPTQTKQKKPNN